MSMSKKDYEAIARSISVAQANPSHFYVSVEDAYTRGVYSTAVAIANHCAADNPKFDRARFLRACGVQPAS